MFTSEIVSRSLSRVRFSAKSDAPITYAEAQKAQDGHDYCADGYGCDSLSVRSEMQDGKRIYIATWGCAGTCD